MIHSFILIMIIELRQSTGKFISECKNRGFVIIIQSIERRGHPVRPLIPKFPSDVHLINALLAIISYFLVIFLILSSSVRYLLSLFFILLRNENLGLSEAPYDQESEAKWASAWISCSCQKYASTKRQISFPISIYSLEKYKSH